MKLFGAHRSGKHITHCVRRTVVLICLVWAGHAQALPLQLQLQIDVRAAAAIKQQMAMADCLPCASCYMAPPSAARMAGSGDHPDVAAASWIMRLDLPTDSHAFVPEGSVRPALALRVLYCRWLN
ncbi:hypothetical protein ACFOFO_10470 [Undibacterium arcticum]|uniref:DUF2946 domain-containing protein n=1 Tax=Undibacterium arcticum TaxID=1762892 RepID=A0ABV7F0E6_9BURK